MKNISIILLSLVMTSCMTQRRVYRYIREHPLPSTSDTLIREVVRDTIIYRDTTIYITLPGGSGRDSVGVDTGEVEIRAKKPSRGLNLRYIPDTATVKTNLAIAKAWLDPGPPAYIHVTLHQHDTLLAVKLDSALAREQHWRDRYMEVKKTQTVPQRFIPNLYKVTFWIVIIEVISLILFLVLKFFRI